MWKKVNCLQIAYTTPQAPAPQKTKKKTQGRNER